MDWSRIESDWLSFDSTVITRYTDQEGAERGYNPTKRGRPSHHPLLAFLNGSKIVLNLWNRAGNTSSANNSIDFFECCYSRVSTLIKVNGVLADSGFYMESFIHAIESKGLNYVITAKLYSTIQREIYARWRCRETKELGTKINKGNLGLFFRPKTSFFCFEHHIV